MQYKAKFFTLKRRWYIYNTASPTQMLWPIEKASAEKTVEILNAATGGVPPWVLDEMRNCTHVISDNYKPTRELDKDLADGGASSCRKSQACDELAAELTQLRDTIAYDWESARIRCEIQISLHKISGIVAIARQDGMLAEKPDDYKTLIAVSMNQADRDCCTDAVIHELNFLASAYWNRAKKVIES